MPSRNYFVARLITVRYVIALGLIALFVTASFLVLDRAIETQRDGFEIVEFAAKQRMSSQRIGFLSNGLINVKDERLREYYRDALRRIITEMEDRHDVLSLHTGRLRMPENMRNILREIYHSGQNPFDPQVKSFFQNARALLEIGNNDLQPDLPALVKVNFSVDRILQTHELIVRLLRNEAARTVSRIEQLDAVLWLLTLVLLAVEIPLIFRPMAQRATKSLQRIEFARRKAEREAAAAEEAREGQASFIRTMSHELRTPLNAILGMAQLLRMSRLRPKQDEYVKDIHQAGESLLELIDGILEFSRLEAGQVTIELAETSVEEQLGQTVSMFRALAENKALELSCRIDPRLAACYRSDETRIRQILFNLVGNAIKFTNEGSITVRAIYAGPAGADVDLVRFEVEDTGIGVPPDRREQIFEEFQQADTSLARKYGGSGLGLAISRRIVRLMGGQIGVRSRDRQGSVFWFTLPLLRMAAPERHDKKSLLSADDLKQAG